MMGGTSSSGSGSAEGSSDIRTELPPMELMAHFSTQLENAGWQLLDGGYTDTFSWDTWKKLDNKRKR